jgi:hypothetical protein
VSDVECTILDCRDTSVIQAIIEIREAMAENLPKPEKSIKQMEQQRKKLGKKNEQ